MAGWSRKKRLKVEEDFHIFLDRCMINSKDVGVPISLGKNLFDGQQRFVTAVFDALEADIHKIFCLKSRQLGLSTIARALATFFLGIHKGLKGAIVFDTDQNKGEARSDLETMINDLPASLQFPAIKGNNRAGLTLANDSKVLFMSAGVRKSKTSGTLGRSVGLSLALMSELCSFDNEEGLEAFEQSLSEVNPNRLYIYESTARGFNRWKEMWDEALLDTLHCKCVFLGWWSKPSQRIERDHIDFPVYGEQPPTDIEIAKIKAVKQLYDHVVTPEQLAWVRRKMDPSARSEGDEPVEYVGSNTRVQEQPWTAEEAFQQTGSVFFAPENLTEITNKWGSKKFKSYMFLAGAEFTDMRVYPAANQKSIELKVWEEPDPEGSYVIGVDPAYGTSAINCRSAIEVFRCYADGIDQVAEYAWPLITTYQLAWVVAALMGWYGAGPRSEVRYILELNGPGEAVFNELRSLKHKVENAPLPAFDEKGLRDVFRNVKTYIFSRADSMTAGFNYHLKTTEQLKVTFLERFRDHSAQGIIRLRSLALLDEMRWVSREGDSISAAGSKKDDRVMGAAFASHCWEEKVRRNLIVQKRTREIESTRKQMSIVSQVALFNQNHLEQFFKDKTKVRLQEQMGVQRSAWRYGTRRY